MVYLELSPGNEVFPQLFSIGANFPTRDPGDLLFFF
jgi:hypothetical protein